MSKYIDADRLIETLNKEKVPFNDDVNYFILNAHAADVQEVRHGRWLRTYHNKQYKKCSVCESVFSVNLPKNANYCPTCGAKMDEVDE